MHLFDLGWERSCDPAATSSSSFSSKTRRCFDSVPRQSFWTVPVMQRRFPTVQTVLKTVDIAQVPFVDKVDDLPVIVQVQEKVQTVQISCSSWTRLLTCPLLCMSWFWSRQRSYAQFWTRLLTCPLLCKFRGRSRQCRFLAVRGQGC